MRRITVAISGTRLARATRSGITSLRAVLASDDGAVLTEYALILALFSLFGFAGFMLVIKTLCDAFVRIAMALGNSAAHAQATTIYFP